MENNFTKVIWVLIWPFELAEHGVRKMAAIWYFTLWSCLWVAASSSVATCSAEDSVPLDISVGVEWITYEDLHCPVGASG